jgi:hypothetical protein
MGKELRLPAAAVLKRRERIPTMKKTMMSVLGLAAAFAAGFATNSWLPGEAVAQAQSRPRVYELRTYTAADGKLDLLHSRFKTHIMGFFQKHGMTNVIYFKPMDAPLSQTTMIYLLSHESRETAAKSWEAFRNDPDWKKASSETGPLASKVESVFLEPTDYSPLK